MSFLAVSVDHPIANLYDNDKNFENLDDLKDKLLKAGVEVRMSKDNVKLVPMLNFDLAAIERIL